MHSKVSSDWLPSYIKTTWPVLEIFKMAGYFPDNPRIAICGRPVPKIILHNIIKIRLSKKKGSYWTKYVFYFLYNFCLIHFSLWEGLSEIWSQMYTGLCGSFQPILSDFKGNLIFAADFRRTLKYQISLKSLQWKPIWCIPTDGQRDTQAARKTDMTKLFWNFAKKPKNHSRSRMFGQLDIHFI